LPGADMRWPSQVLATLNNVFPNEMHGGKFFTIWYGVYQPSTRMLAWSGGGHHPAILLGGREPVSLASTGPIMGAFSEMVFPHEACQVGSDARLLIFSDGVFEILRDDCVVWDLSGCTEYLVTEGDANRSEIPLMDRLLAHARDLRGSSQLQDDFSVIDARFQ
jgi:serine phosphatase RsbU (regulator of sigma subunit)